MTGISVKMKQEVERLRGVKGDLEAQDSEKAQKVRNDNGTGTGTGT